MIALYLGVGITIFLIVVGVVVECLRKRYYDEQDDSLTSLDSNDDIQSSSLKEQSSKKQQSKYGSEFNRSGGTSKDRKDGLSRGGGAAGGSGSQNIRKEGGTRDHYEYDQDEDLDTKKGRDYCPCYDQIARSTETCATFCLGGEDNDLEELEYQAHKRQKER